MRLYGDGFLMTFTEVAVAGEADFNDWYNREHLDERINLPGFRRARRYTAIDAEIKYLATHEAGAPDDIGSPRYLEVLGQQTDWSRRVMASFSKWHRMAGRVVCDRTHGMGAFMTMVRFFPDPARTDALAAWLADGVLDAINVFPDVVGSCAVAVDLAVDACLAVALGQTLDNAATPEWAVLVEGAEIEATLAVARTHLDARLAEAALAGTTPRYETWYYIYGNLRASDDVQA